MAIILALRYLKKEREKEKGGREGGKKKEKEKNLKAQACRSHQAASI